MLHPQIIWENKNGLTAPYKRRTVSICKGSRRVVVDTSTRSHLIRRPACLLPRPSKSQDQVDLPSCLAERLSDFVGRLTAIGEVIDGLIPVII